MRHFRFHLLALLACLLMLGGCSQEQLDRAQAKVDEANRILAIAEAAEMKAQDAIAKVTALSAMIPLPQAQAAIAAANAGLAIATEATQGAKALVARAQVSKDAAQDAHDKGEGTAKVLWAALMGLLGLAARQPQVGKLKTAVRLTAAHADAMETAEDDDDVAYAKDNTVAAQNAAGVLDLIKGLRGKG